MLKKSDYFYSFYQFHRIKEPLLQLEDLEENKIHSSVV